MHLPRSMKAIELNRGVYLSHPAQNSIDFSPRGRNVRRTEPSRCMLIFRSGRRPRREAPRQLFLLRRGFCFFVDHGQRSSPEATVCRKGYVKFLNTAQKSINHTASNILRTKASGRRDSRVYVILKVSTRELPSLMLDVSASHLQRLCPVPARSLLFGFSHRVTPTIIVGRQPGYSEWMSFTSVHRSAEYISKPTLSCRRRWGLS
ncbi:hypothetical protein OF83DRAFT_646476 [Amylostereum chailletii]|nr:hypothetical protein OF83DRAFT_646476 [Amylostereum chailletii]